ncbi:MAG: MASE1 domain-containing protein [Thermoleophilia bacterium]|nr:MASE1 domain-containing protein [Thermoleophilia bacterium]
MTSAAGRATARAALSRPRLTAARARAAAVFAGVLGAYVGTAKLGIELPVGHGVITPVWAPSGIALAALLILGVRFWPAVAAGAFLANATSGASLAVAAGIAVGNTLEAVVGAVLVLRIGGDARLERVRSVLGLVVGGAVVSTAIAATNGVAVLSLAGETEETFGSAWLLWWFGDAVGDLMVAPLLLVLYAARRARPTPAQVLEGTALVAAVVAVSAVVFLLGAWRYPYLIFPVLLWGALRFRQLGAAVTSFVVGAIGTWGAVVGTVPLAAETATERVQVAQALFVVVAITLLLVGATLSEREAGRTALAEAQVLAHVGSWRWDVRRDAVTWTDELHRIFGVEPQRHPVTYAAYLDRVHPEDRAAVDAAVRQAFADRQPFAFEHRIVRPDGAERVVASRGQVLVEGGEPIAMLGTAQDVTEHRQAERLRDDMLAAVSHELRTPLTAVLGFAVTLQQRREALAGEEIDAIVRELAAAARRLDRLLADLLDVERARRGVTGVSRRETEVRELVERAVAACALDGRRLTVHGGPVVAEVDTPKVERIVENLVVNAVKHTPPESAIDVRVAREGRDLLLVVEDDGPGIPAAFREEIFETFNRGPSMLSATPGAGIGLSLVARFAAVHGGRSWVADRPGGGASFRVLLPDCVVRDADGPPT